MTFGLLGFSRMHRSVEHLAANREKTEETNSRFVIIYFSVYKHFTRPVCTRECVNIENPRKQLTSCQFVNNNTISTPDTTTTTVGCKN